MIHAGKKSIPLSSDELFPPSSSFYKETMEEGKRATCHTPCLLFHMHTHIIYREKKRKKKPYSACSLPKCWGEKRCHANYLFQMQTQPQANKHSNLSLALQTNPLPYYLNKKLILAVQIYNYVLSFL